MAGRPGAKLIEAMQLLLANEGKRDEDKLTPYAAAQMAGIALSTIYRSALYRQWREARREPDPARHAARMQALADHLAALAAECAARC